MPLSVYPGTYTFTREQLETLLVTVLCEARWRRLATDDSGAYGTHDMAWPKVCAAVITETLFLLDFDATRPEEPNL